MARNRSSRKAQSDSTGLQTVLSVAALSLLLVCFALAVIIVSLMRGNPGSSANRETIVVSLLASPEKQAVLPGLVDRFNKTKPRLEKRAVQATVSFAESGEMIDSVLTAVTQPVVISPASSTWLTQLNAEWRSRTQSATNLAPNPRPLFISPIVIGMWENMATAMGHPGQQIGWTEIISATLDAKGWGAFGHPEWGAFRFAHASPDTDSGRLATLAEFFAAAGKVRGLNEADLQSQAVRDYVRNIERGIVQYGESDTALLDVMRQRGQQALSAAVMEEQALIQFNAGRPQQRLAAIYPKEGTFWADHPFAILDGEWVQPEQKAAAKLLLEFLLAPEQQKAAVQAGFRPGNLDVTLDGTPISTANGADPGQPKTLLAVPDANILAAVRNAWTLTKKPANIYLVADVSGSMSGDKLEKARQGLLEFVAAIADTDQVGLVKFASSVERTVPLAGMNRGQRTRLQDEIKRMAAGGNTALYEVTQTAVQDLVRKGDKNSINAVVLMTDGKETMGGSKSNLINYLRTVQRDSQRSGVQIKVFAIAYGSDADMRVLTDVADATEGKALPGATDTIKKLYKLLSTYF